MANCVSTDGATTSLLSWLVVVLVVVNSFAVVCDFLRRVSARVFLVLCSGCFAPMGAPRIPSSRGDAGFVPCCFRAVRAVARARAIRECAIMI